MASGYEKDGFAFLTDGFELSEMMPPPSAANDVSPLTLRNDVAPIGRNDAMFAHHVSQARSITEGSLIGEANIICPKGQTSLKKAL